MKKKLIITLLFSVIFSIYAQNVSDAVQIANPESVNLSSSESAWLPGQIQDKLKSNFQEYLGIKTIVDSKAEEQLKKLQAESENVGRDVNTAIELGKIASAKYAVFTKIRKTGSGYAISLDYTDLTTGIQKASVSSKEYSKVEYLYGTTGAVDELTLALGKKLGINISELNRNLLTSGSSNFSVDEELALVKQNTEQFNKQMRDYDEQLEKLKTSNDINAIQDKNRIEAEKALLREKQAAEKKRQVALKEKKKLSEEDEKLDAERSIALKTQRDKMAKEASEKAAEVRKLKIEKQGVLGQIGVIEAKKKALVEIKESVEKRAGELYYQMIEDFYTESQMIAGKKYLTAELGSNGQPTEEAITRRNKQLVKCTQDYTNKFYADVGLVEKSTQSQQESLLKDIRADQKNLATKRTVSSLGEELKVIFGKYEGSKNGWNAYLSLYSDGVFLYSDSFIVEYEALSGKTAPDMKNELNDAVIEEYSNNIDMFNSLLTRGDPIIYFEMDYNVSDESDDFPSQYKFCFSEIRAINTLSGKVSQTSILKDELKRTMTPAIDIRDKKGIVSNVKNIPEDKRLQIYYEDYYPLLQKKKVEEVYIAAEKKAEKEKLMAAERTEKAHLSMTLANLESAMIDIPGKGFKMCAYETTQNLYREVMGENPSKYKGLDLPAENVNWYDAIKFCNELSRRTGQAPYYADELKYFNRKTHKFVTKKDYDHEQKKSYKDKNIFLYVEVYSSANGYRLPTVEEWKYCAKGGENYKYAGSDDINEVAWCKDNSGGKTHPVSQKKPNAFGLFDMRGNVSEWCWDVSYSNDYSYRYYCGDSCFGKKDCDINSADSRSGDLGFRIVRNK